MCFLCFVSSAAAKKAAGSHPESSGEKLFKEGINGEVEEVEPKGKAKDGQEVASGSKPRVYRRAEASEGSGPGELKASDRDTRCCCCRTGPVLSLWVRMLWEMLTLCERSGIYPLWDLLLLSSITLHRPAAGDCGGSGSSNGQEKCSKAEGDAGPSCSSSSKDAGDSKSKFFEDSEESEEGEEEGSDEEVRASHHGTPF